MMTYVPWVCENCYHAWNDGLSSNRCPKCGSMTITHSKPMYIGVESKGIQYCMKCGKHLNGSYCGGCGKHFYKGVLK